MTRSSNLLAHRVARGLLYLLLFLIPFSVAAIEILFPLLFIVWIMGWHWPGRKHLSVWSSSRAQTVLFALLAYLAVCTWSVTFSNYPALSLEGLIGKTFEYALLFIMASDITHDPHVARRGIQALWTAAWIIGIYAAVQEWLIHHPIRHVQVLDPIKGRPLDYGRMVGPYKNPNNLATFLIVAILTVAAQILVHRKRSQVGLWTLLILLLGCLAYTLSRGAFLGFAIGLSFLFMINQRRKKVWIVAGVALVLVTGLLLTKTHLRDVLTLSDVGSQERNIMWNTAWRMIQARPIVGVGLNTFMANYLHYVAGPNQGPAYAHNCFLQIAAETGLIGLICFLWFTGSLFLSCWRRLRTIDSEETSLKPWLAGVTAGLLAFLIQSMFDTNLYALRQAALFWTLAGLAFGASQSAAKEPPPSHG